MKTRALSWLAGAALALTLPAVAHAGSPDGKLQVKLLGTAVVADGKIDRILNATPAIAAALPPGTDTKANTNYVPTVAVEYFFTPHVSVETICCFTEHHVDGAGAIAGVNNLINNALIIPATVTLKAHVNLGPIKPYIGAGPAYFIVLNSEVGPGARAALGATSAELKSKFGAALQAGFDIPLNDKGLGLSFDAKRHFIRPIATFSNASGELLATRHKLDTWLLSAGLTYRF